MNDWLDIWRGRWQPFLALILGVLAILIWAWSIVPVRAAETCGVASFYSSAHHGKKMANGQRFNMYANTAAMWDVPFGSKYRVTHKGKSVTVTITDRGPAKRLGRIIDLSYGAARKLGMLEAGLARVCLTRIK